MIPRYEHAGIKAIWTDRAKLARWDRVELAVVEARMKLGLVSEEDWRTILGFVSKSEVDIPAWLEREKEMGHDLAAYVELRWEGLPAELRHHFHDGMTSYDTEDPAFVLALQKSSGLAPYYGAGQIAPRTLYASLAQAEGLVAKVLEKIAIDFQLGARSGCPLWQEPFGRAQKGSSAMPHKKNPIRT